MKKLIWIFVVVGFVVLSGMLARNPAMKPAFYTLIGDTMTVNNSDGICSAVIDVPENATGSVYLYGSSRVIDGHTPTSIRIPPGGNYSFNAWNSSIEIDYLMIVCQDTAQITLTAVH